MTNIMGPAAKRSLVLGEAVNRAAALQPATTQAAIFTVAGGKVLVTSLVGEVVVATPATANTVKVTGNPTSGTDVDWCTATSTASKEVGSIISLPGAVASGLTVSNAGGGNPFPANGQIAQIGTIDLVTTGTAATGTIKWTLTYVPIDDGATVTAA
jgi:hypothetical protein